jgi:hypothetical protein
MLPAAHRTAATIINGMARIARRDASCHASSGIRA